MSKYTKKPVTIDAIQWTGQNLRDVIRFTDGRLDTDGTHAGMAWETYCDLVDREGLKIYTLEGRMNADVGDWIIKGVKGEHYPCKPDVFDLSYTASPTNHSEQTINTMPAVSDGYAIMPTALTAENGAKAAMLGEFSIDLQQHCPECSHEDGDIDCELCGGDVEYTETVMIDWTTIKEIYAKAVDLLAASPAAKGGDV